MTTFPQQVIALVRKVPEGRLVSYGQIARALGRPKASRIVGGVMSALGPEHGDVPWHRVLNRQGGISTRSDPFSDRDPMTEQAERLLNEGLIKPSECSVALLSGSGLKATDKIMHLREAPPA